MDGTRHGVVAPQAPSLDPGKTIMRYGEALVRHAGMAGRRVAEAAVLATSAGQLIHVAQPTGLGARVQRVAPGLVGVASGTTQGQAFCGAVVQVGESNRSEGDLTRYVGLVACGARAGLGRNRRQLPVRQTALVALGACQVTMGVPISARSRVGGTGGRQDQKRQ